MARSLLDELPRDRDLVFASASNTAVQAWLRRWCDRNDVQPRFTPHDLRRSFVTRLNDLRVAPYVVEKLVNHTLQGVMAIYNRAEYARERYRATQLWGDTLERIVR